MHRVRDWQWLLLIVVLGLVVRAVGVSARLSHDEGYSWLVATAPDWHAFLSRMAATENTPPLFYALLAPLPLDSEFWLRLPSLLAGTLWIPATYGIVRSLAERRAALLAALAVAVAPFAVSYSDYSRAFMVAGLCELIALLAAVKLVHRSGRAARWALVYVIAAAAAFYSEYYCLAFHAVLIVVLATLDRARWRLWLLLGVAPLLLFVPWAGQWHRSADQLGITKLDAVRRAPGPARIRDALVPLVAGEHGAGGSAALRWVEALLIGGVTVWSLYRLRANRVAAWLLGGLLGGVLVTHWIASATTSDVFQQRYLTILIPLSAAAVAIAASRLPPRWIVPAAAVLLAVGGGALAIHRAGREYEPDHAGAVALVRKAGIRTIYTNSAVIAFYGRDLHVVLDRPFGLSGGRAASCPSRCAIADDARYGGLRPGLAPQAHVGPIALQLVGR